MVVRLMPQGDVNVNRGTVLKLRDVEDTDGQALPDGNWLVTDTGNVGGLAVVELGRYFTFTTPPSSITALMASLHLLQEGYETIPVDPKLSQLDRFGEVDLEFLARQASNMGQAGTDGASQYESSLKIPGGSVMGLVYSYLLRDPEMSMEATIDVHRDALAYVEIWLTHQGKVHVIFKQMNLPPKELDNTHVMLKDLSRLGYSPLSGDDYFPRFFPGEVGMKDYTTFSAARDEVDNLASRLSVIDKLRLSGRSFLVENDLDRYVRPPT